MSNQTATVLAGIPANNMALYHRVRFLVHDPAAFVLLPVNGGVESTLILRDIEMGRAKQKAQVDHVACPKDFEPSAGLSGDRETATAQSVAELLQRKGVTDVRSDRSLPLIYAEMMNRVGITTTCDLDLGVSERRAKDAQEVEWLREAQAVTEDVMRRACEKVAGATADDQGILIADRAPLTSERLRALIDVWLLKIGYANPSSIVASGPQGSDCHDFGSGPLCTGEPVIIDIFPRNRETLYNGDCTRTVVHGEISETLHKMHAAVVAAKQAGIAAVKPGASGQAVHEATIAVIKQQGFDVGLPDDDTPAEYTAMVHGTGHGIGLEVHEPPLLDFGGPDLVVGDALTVEPGLYSRAIGGIRVEDMVVVTPDGCENLNQLPEGLDWS